MTCGWGDTFLWYGSQCHEPGVRCSFSTLGDPEETVRAMSLRDRVDGGREFARKLSCYADRDDVIVFGISRGGVPVTFEVAEALNAPLDVFLSQQTDLTGRGAGYDSRADYRTGRFCERSVN